jgi:subtilisin family serine protease
MKRTLIVLIILAMVMTGVSASAQTQRLIVQDTLGIKGLSATCLLLGCRVLQPVGDPQGKTFVVSVSNLSLNKVLSLLPLQLGVIGVEVDQVISLTSPLLGALPLELNDTAPVSYYGGMVSHGYLAQPANQIIRTSQTQNTFRVSGTGTVAVIDTGIDPNHPAFVGVVLQGYDFTRNKSGANEMGDLDHSTAAVLDGGGGTPTFISPSLAAVVSPTAAVLLGNSQYAAFGHGTMTAGLVHLVAPTAKLLPLKAFSSNGTGYVSNVITAIYYAVNNHANVISMSFDFANSSADLLDAIKYANGKGIICVASAGNDGSQTKVYPAGYPQVIGVGSTSDTDIQSTFTNYGSQVMWVAAPGEHVTSTYPAGTYASSSGTSFSAPLVAGTAALLVNVSATVNQSTASTALSHAKWIAPDMAYGRLDTYQTVSWFVNMITRTRSAGWHHVYRVMP